MTGATIFIAIVGIAGIVYFLYDTYNERHSQKIGNLYVRQINSTYINILGDRSLQNVFLYL